MVGPSEENPFLFNGDFVDRGPPSPQSLGFGGFLKVGKVLFARDHVDSIGLQNGPASALLLVPRES